MSVIYPRSIEEICAKGYGGWRWWWCVCGERFCEELLDGCLIVCRRMEEVGSMGRAGL